MVIEDYTPIKFGVLEPGPPPLTCVGKFVHIIGPPDEYLVFSTMELTKYHANIVERFSRNRDELSFVMYPGGDDGRLMTPGWEVVGGGLFRVNRTTTLLELWGTSKAYGAFDGPALREKIHTVPGWENYAVRMGAPK